MFEIKRRKLQQQAMNLMSVLNYNLDFNEPYQRGHVWTHEQKIALLDSVFEELPISAVYINIYDYSKPVAVVDGKQRLSALQSYINNEYEYQGYYYRDLPKEHQMAIKMFVVPTVITHYQTVEECEELYNRINYYGTPHQQ